MIDGFSWDDKNVRSSESSLRREAAVLKNASFKATTWWVAPFVDSWTMRERPVGLW